MALKLITPPSDFPISLEEVKERLGISSTDSDAHIRGLLAGASTALERYLNRAFMPQTWDLILDRWPTEGDLFLPLGPLISVDSVNYVNPNTALEDVFGEDGYTVDDESDPGWIIVGDDGWPDVLDTINAVRVRFTAGYQLLSEGSPATPGVPAPICQAIAMLVHDWFENRGVMQSGDPLLPASVRAMVANYRVFE